LNPKGPTISIITASLNAGTTIRDCVQSVKKQICPVEHIIVDGASTDDTVAIAEKFARSDALIASERDNGLYEAINKGIKRASGDIIGTLNADDFYPHNRIVPIVQRIFEDPDVDACYGDLAYVDRKDTSRIVRYWRSSPYQDKLMNSGWMPPHPTFFVRRSVYENHGMYRLDMGTAADYEFLLRALAVKRIRVLYIPTLITVMRIGGLSSSSLQARWRANRMDRKAWTVNGLEPKPWTLIAKPLRKSSQYIFKKVYGKPWLDFGYPGKTDPEAQENEPESARTIGVRAGSCGNAVTSSDRARTPFYVVTVNYHAEKEIGRLINSLRSVDGLKKLIIVDHSGSDRLSETKAEFPILIIQQENRGYGAGLNRGLRQIPDQDAIVMLCNPDTAILNPEKLKYALDYMSQSPEIGCLIPRLLTREGASQPAARRFYTLTTLLTARNPWILKKWPEYLWRHYYSEDLGNAPYEIDWGSGSAMFVKSSLFPYPISFDERFFLYFEDVDLCAQMWNHGFSVVHYPELIIWHAGARLSRRSIYYLGVHLASLIKFIKKYRGLYHRNRLSTASD
jgi:GT2 family glycosyltransferase